MRGCTGVVVSGRLISSASELCSIGSIVHLFLQITAGFTDKHAPCFRLNLPIFGSCMHVSVGRLQVSFLSFKYCFEKKCFAKMSAKLLFQIESRPITNSNGLSSFRRTVS